MKAPAPPPPGAIQNGAVNDIDINENVKVLSTYNAIAYVVDDGKKWQPISDDYVSIYCCDNGGEDLASRYILSFVEQRKILLEFGITSLTKVKVKDSFVRLNDDKNALGIRFSKLDTATQFHQQLCDLVAELVPYAKVNKKKIMRQVSGGSIVSDVETSQAINDMTTSNAKVKNAQDVVLINIQTSPNEQTQFKALPHLTLKEILHMVCKTEKIDPDSCNFQYIDIKEPQVSMELTASELRSKNIRLFNTKDGKKNVEVKPAEKKLEKKSKFSIFPNKKKSEARLTTPEPNEFHFNIEEPVWSGFLHLANLHADELSNSRIITLIESFVKERGGYTYLRQVNDQKMSPQLADDLNTLAGQVHGLGNSPDPKLQREDSEEILTSPGTTTTLQRKKKKRAPPPPSSSNSELNRMSSFDDMNNNPAYQRISDMKLEIKALDQPAPSPGGKRRAPAVPSTKRSENTSPISNVKTDPLLKESTSVASSNTSEKKHPPVFVPPPPPHEPPPEEVPVTPVAPLSPTTMAFVETLPAEYPKQNDDTEAENNTEAKIKTEEASEENRLLSDLDDILEKETLQNTEDKILESPSMDKGPILVTDSRNTQTDKVEFEGNNKVDLNSKESINIETNSENVIKPESDKLATESSLLEKKHAHVPEEKPLPLDSVTGTSDQAKCSQEKSNEVVSEALVSKDGISKEVVLKDISSKDAASEDDVSKDDVSKEDVSKEAESKDAASKNAVSKEAVSNGGISDDGSLNTQQQLMQQQLLQLQLQVQQQQQMLLAAGIQAPVGSAVLAQPSVPPKQTSINVPKSPDSSVVLKKELTPAPGPTLHPKASDDQTVSPPTSEQTPKEMHRGRAMTQPGKPKNPVISKKPPTGLYAKLKARTASTSAIENSTNRAPTVLRSFSEQTPSIIEYSRDSSTKEPSNITSLKSECLKSDEKSLEVSDVKPAVKTLAKNSECPNRDVHIEPVQKSSISVEAEMSRASSERNKVALENLDSRTDKNDRLVESIFHTSSIDEVTTSDHHENLKPSSVDVKSSVLNSDIVNSDKKTEMTEISLDKVSVVNEVPNVNATANNAAVPLVTHETNEERVTKAETGEEKKSSTMENTDDAVKKTAKKETKLESFPRVDVVQDKDSNDLLPKAIADRNSNAKETYASPSKASDLSIQENAKDEVFPKTATKAQQSIIENYSVVGRAHENIENETKVTEHINQKVESVELSKTKSTEDTETIRQIVPPEELRKKYDPNALVVFPGERKKFDKEPLVTSHNISENPLLNKKYLPTSKSTNIVRSAINSQTLSSTNATNTHQKLPSNAEQKNGNNQSSSSNVVRNDQYKPNAECKIVNTQNSTIAVGNPVNSKGSPLNIRNASDKHNSLNHSAAIHSQASSTINQERIDLPSQSARERLIQNIQTYGSPKDDEVPKTSVNKGSSTPQRNFNIPSSNPNVGLSKPATNDARKSQTLPVQRSKNIPVKKEYIFNLPKAAVDKTNATTRKAPDVKAKPLLKDQKSRSETLERKTLYTRSVSQDNQSNGSGAVSEFPRPNNDNQVEHNIRPSDVFSAREKPKKEPPKVLPKRNSVRVKSPEESSEHNVKPSELFGVSKTLPRQFKIKTNNNDIDLRSSAAFHDS